MFVIMKNYDKLHHAMFDVVRNNDEICCFSISLFLAMFDVMRDFEIFFLFQHVLLLLAIFDIMGNYDEICCFSISFFLARFDEK